MVHVGNFEGGEVVGIDTERRDPNALVIVVLNFQPYRLDALLVKIKTKDLPGFFTAEYGCRDLNHAVGLALSPIPEDCFVYGAGLECGATVKGQETGD